MAKPEPEWWGEARQIMEEDPTLTDSEVGALVGRSGPSIWRLRHLAESREYAAAYNRQRRANNALLARSSVRAPYRPGIDPKPEWLQRRAA